MKKYIETVIERADGLNEYGVQVVNELVKIQTACNTEYVWYKTVCGNKSIVCSFKTEKRMRVAMADFGFYNT